MECNVKDGLLTLGNKRFKNTKGHGWDVIQKLMIFEEKNYFFRMNFV